MRRQLGVALVALAAAPLAYARDIGYTIATPSGFTRLATGRFNGTLHRTQVQSIYTYAPYVLTLSGTRYQMGFDLGQLTGNMSVSNYQHLLQSILGNSTLEPVFQLAVEAFLDWQWDDYLSKQVPQDFLEELQGADAGGQVGGVKDLGRLLSRGLVLANTPSTITDMVYVLLDELEHSSSTSRTAAFVRAQAAAVHAGFATGIRGLLQATRFQPMQCSMAGIWGSRTVGGKLFTMRNLDWLKDSGINQYKLVTIFRPINATAHVTLGFAGLLGALTGMSQNGITVHEANLEEKAETFRGFPWMLRLRWIMEHADSLSSAIALWNATNNTVGFNHGIGSARDNRMVVFETNAEGSAMFMDNDPREQAATYVNPSSNSTEQLGFPLPEAVWRTNNPFDPQMRAGFLWSQAPTADTNVRYRIIHDAIAALEGTPAGLLDLLNVTAVVAPKGKDFFQCPDAPEGGNVLSVTYDPNSLVLYAAWESGANTTWRTAACGTYVKFDMTAWF